MNAQPVSVGKRDNAMRQVQRISMVNVLDRRPFRIPATYILVGVKGMGLGSILCQLSLSAAGQRHDVDSLRDRCHGVAPRRESMSWLCPAVLRDN